jgi:hypothetical protein
MDASVIYPKIEKVEPLTHKLLLVHFQNGVKKIYDCTPLIEYPVFQPLCDDALFRCAHADPHGYGVIWNDEIDLAESEVWINGQTIEIGN